MTCKPPLRIMVSDRHLIFARLPTKILSNSAVCDKCFNTLPGAIMYPRSEITNAGAGLVGYGTCC